MSGGDEIREVCTIIVAICRRLGASWAAMSADMNILAEDREKAAHEASRLQGAASAIETIIGDHAELSQRVIEAERKLYDIAERVEAHAKLSLSGLADKYAHNQAHNQLITSIRQILEKK